MLREPDNPRYYEYSHFYMKGVYRRTDFPDDSRRKYSKLHFISIQIQYCYSGTHPEAMTKTSL